MFRAIKRVFIWLGLAAEKATETDAINEAVVERGIRDSKVKADKAHYANGQLAGQIALLKDQIKRQERQRDELQSLLQAAAAANDEANGAQQAERREWTESSEACHFRLPSWPLHPRVRKHNSLLGLLPCYLSMVSPTRPGVASPATMLSCACDRQYEGSHDYSTAAWRSPAWSARTLGDRLRLSERLRHVAQRPHGREEHKEERQAGCERADPDCGTR